MASWVAHNVAPLATLTFSVGERPRGGALRTYMPDAALLRALVVAQIPRNRTLSSRRKNGEKARSKRERGPEARRGRVA